MEEEQTGCSVKPCPAPVILQSFLLTCHPPVCQKPSQQRQRETDGEETRERERIPQWQAATVEVLHLRGADVYRQTKPHPVSKKIKSIEQSHNAHASQFTA